MANQIVKQPNGLFAVYSSVVDDFTILDATPEEIASEWSQAESERIAKRVAEICEQLTAGGKPYFQFTMTWEQANAKREFYHGGGVGAEVGHE